MGAVSGLFILVCLVILLLCFATTSDHSRNAIQTVYPTPEFQYFTSTMLTRVKQKNEQISLQPYQSAFSLMSTQPASSLSTITISPAYNEAYSRETCGISPYDHNKPSDYMRI